MMREMSKALAAACAAAGVIVLAAATPASATTKCRATVAKESAKLTQGIAKILQKCEAGVLANKVTGPCPDTKSLEKITKSKGKLTAAIEKSCVGATGEFAFGRCPNANGGPEATGPCTGILIQSLADIGECLGCLADENASELVSDLMYADFLPGAPGDIPKCQTAVGKNVNAFYVSKSKALAKCQDALLKGKVPSCPDQKASDAIAKAESKKVSSIAKACCGENGACGGGTCTQGGGDSGDPCEANRDCNRCTAGAAIGDPCFVTPECPNYTAPAGTCSVGLCTAGPKTGQACANDAACNQSGACSTDGLCESDDYRPVQDLGFPASCQSSNLGGTPILAVTGQTMQSVLDCLDTQAGARAQCQDEAGASFAVQTLGGGCTQAPATCTPNGSTVNVQVSLAGTGVGGISISLGYQNVTLPGSGDVSAGRVTNLQSGLLVVNDTDDALITSIAELGGLVAGPLYQVEFDTCGAPPTAADFGCVVRGAADTSGNALLEGVSCSVTVL